MCSVSPLKEQEEKEIWILACMGILRDHSFKKCKEMYKKGRPKYSKQNKTGAGS